ncbi:MAG: hypothetical protein V3S94_02435 [Gammaproteobacteria bacterium]
MTDSATSWIENEDRGCRDARIARLEWLATNYPANRHGFLLSGGWLSLQLLEEARCCFTYGQFLATAVLGVAFVERLLAAKFFAAGRDDLERAGGQALLREGLECGWLTETEFDQFDRVRQLRHSLIHFRRPLAQGTVERRSVQQEREPEHVIEEDARGILAVVFAVLAKEAV